MRGQAAHTLLLLLLSRCPRIIPFCNAQPSFHWCCCCCCCRCYGHLPNLLQLDRRDCAAPLASSVRLAEPSSAHAANEDA